MKYKPVKNIEDVDTVRYLNKLDDSILQKVYGLRHTEIHKIRRDAIKNRNKKVVPPMSPGEQRTQTEIFSGDGRIDLWNEINNAKTCTDLRVALYTVCCRIQELESLVRSNIKG